MGLRRSPLGATSGQPVVVARGGDVEIAERPFLAQILLRVDPDPAAIAAVEGGTGLRLPTDPNRLVASPQTGRLAISLAPDEWLVVGREDSSTLEGTLAAAVAPRGGAVVDVSAQRTLLELTGSGARDLLAAGCSVDLHPRTFLVGAAAQTTLARVDVIIGRGGVDTYHVAVRASFARYLVAWLTGALRELEGGAA